MQSLFITGASGFIGTHFIRKIKRNHFKYIYCLSRTLTGNISNISAAKNIKLLKGDIYDSAMYSPYLASSDIVVHIAAATGKAKPGEYFEVNAGGTEFLLDHCKKLGVKKLLHVSSIAVKFPEISRYYYAQSKKQGEKAVRNSGVNYTILRPTIVIGSESKVWQNISKLAKTPFPLIFGDGRNKIQPIYIDDLIECLLFVINENIFLNETFDLGGPEIVSFGKFLTEAYKKYHGTIHPKIHVPVNLIVFPLIVLEKMFYSILPLNVGQLSSFIYDGTIDKNRLFIGQLNHMTDVQDMLDIVISREKHAERSKVLNQECKKFLRYLIKQEANEYILRKYQDAHLVYNFRDENNFCYFERFLIFFARLSPLCSKLVDVYTRVFSKRSLFRRKLILLLAIIETCNPYHIHIDSAQTSGKILLTIRFLKSTFSFSIAFFLSIIFLSPLHLMFVVSKKFR